MRACGVNHQTGHGKSSGGGRPRATGHGSSRRPPRPHQILISLKTGTRGVRGRWVQGGRQRPFGQAAAHCARQPDSNVHRPIFAGTLTFSLILISERKTFSLCSATQAGGDRFTSPTLSCAFKHSSSTSRLSPTNPPVPSFGCPDCQWHLSFFFRRGQVHSTTQFWSYARNVQTGPK